MKAAIAFLLWRSSATQAFAQLYSKSEALVRFFGAAAGRPCQTRCVWSL